MENAYGNLKKGLIRVKARNDKPVDVGRLAQVLEKEAGFEPITEVTLELRGRLERRDGKLVLETSGTGQTFTVAGTEAQGGAPREKDLVTVVATLENPKSADRIIVRAWKSEEGPVRGPLQWPVLHID